MDKGGEDKEGETDADTPTVKPRPKPRPKPKPSRKDHITSDSEERGSQSGKPTSMSISLPVLIDMP